MTVHITSQPALAQNCDYYASPNGTGNGLSEASPFTRSDFLAVPENELRSKTLCLPDGTYIESLTILKSGTATQPINNNFLTISYRDWKESVWYANEDTAYQFVTVEYLQVPNDEWYMFLIPRRPN
jgi:hypothetical protein